MYIPKRYGESKSQTCPFCGKQALTQNKQGVPVCLKHKEQGLDNLRCICGSWLEMKKGKWGPFFLCPKCGTINLKKALEVNPVDNPVYKVQEKKKSPGIVVEIPKKPVRKEITVTSDDLDFM